MNKPAIRVLKLYTNKEFTHTGSHLRGALLAQFPERERMHNHYADGKPRHSQIRYVVRDGVPCVVGLGEGRLDLLELYESVNELTTPDLNYEVTGRELAEVPLELGPVDRLVMYRFVTPWIALNQDNHRRFLSSPCEDDRRQLLESIVVGNLLTAARAAGVTLPSTPKLVSRIVQWTQRPIEVAGKRLDGFHGDMVTNIAWNEWLGIGKMTSKGFGLLEEV